MSSRNLIGSIFNLFARRFHSAKLTIINNSFASFGTFRHTSENIKWWIPSNWTANFVLTIFDKCSVDTCQLRRIIVIVSYLFSISFHISFRHESSDRHKIFSHLQIELIQLSKARKVMILTCLTPSKNIICSGSVHVSHRRVFNAALLSTVVGVTLFAADDDEAVADDVAVEIIGANDCCIALDNDGGLYTGSVHFRRRLPIISVVILNNYHRHYTEEPFKYISIWYHLTMSHQLS